MPGGDDCRHARRSCRHLPPPGRASVRTSRLRRRDRAAPGATGPPVHPPRARGSAPHDVACRPPLPPVGGRQVTGAPTARGVHVLGDPRRRRARCCLRRPARASASLRRPGAERARLPARPAGSRTPRASPARSSSASIHGWVSSPAAPPGLRTLVFSVAHARVVDDARLRRRAGRSATPTTRSTTTAPPTRPSSSPSSRSRPNGRWL